MKKKKRFLIGLLTLMFMIGVVTLNSRNAQAAKKYEINISKMSPKAVEKKLSRIKASSKQEFLLRVKATNKKQARKKVKKWLQDFQKVDANTYGVLPIPYFNESYCYSKEPKHKGYYMYDAGYHTGTNWISFTSDYVNMKTICHKAYKAMKGTSEYKGNYFDNLVLKITYTSEKKKGKTIIENYVCNEGPCYDYFKVKECSYTPQKLKEQSDSIRVQYLLYGISEAHLMSYDKKGYKTGKRNIKDRLYEIARGKATGVCLYLAIMHREIATHLSVSIEAANAIAWKENHAVEIIKAKNSRGGWDYFEADNDDVGPCNHWTTIYDWIDRKYLPKKGIWKEVYDWAAHNRQTEADIDYLKKYFKEIKKGEYIKEFLDRESSDYGETDVGPLEFRVENNNKSKYGFYSSYHVAQCMVDPMGGRVKYKWLWN